MVSKIKDEAMAAEFVCQLLDTLFVKHKVELVDKFYTKDVIFHYNDTNLKIKDILDRILAIKNNTTHFSFTLEDIVLINELIVFRVRQNWKIVASDNLSESIVFGVYKMSGDKVKEGWCNSMKRLLLTRKLIEILLLVCSSSICNIKISGILCGG